MSSKLYSREHYKYIVVAQQMEMEFYSGPFMVLMHRMGKIRSLFSQDLWSVRRMWNTQKDGIWKRMWREPGERWTWRASRPSRVEYTAVKKSFMENVVFKVSLEEGVEFGKG